MLLSNFHLRIQVEEASYVKLTMTARGPSLIALKMIAPPGAVFISPPGDNYVSDDDDDDDDDDVEEGEEDVDDISEIVCLVQMYQI